MVIKMRPCERKMIDEGADLLDCELEAKKELLRLDRDNKSEEELLKIEFERIRQCKARRFGELTKNHIESIDGLIKDFILKHIFIITDGVLVQQKWERFMSTKEKYDIPKKFKLADGDTRYEEYDPDMMKFIMNKMYDEIFKFAEFISFKPSDEEIDLLIKNYIINDICTKKPPFNVFKNWGILMEHSEKKRYFPLGFESFGDKYFGYDFRDCKPIMIDMYEKLWELMDGMKLETIDI